MKKARKNYDKAATTNEKTYWEFWDEDQIGPTRMSDSYDYSPVDDYDEDESLYGNKLAEGFSMLGWN